MQLDLVDCGHDPGGVDQRIDVLRLKIADPDGPDPALVAQMGERLEGVDELVQLRHRPVHQVQVEVVDPQPIHAGVECGQRAFVTLVRVPQLGHQVEFVSGHAGLGDSAASRALMRESLLGFAGPQVHVGVSDLSIPGPAGQIPARHYRPVTAKPTPLLFFFQGGGWTIGDLDTHDALCRLTCRDADVHVLSVDYRLAPEHRAPAAGDDAYAAFRWAHDHAADLGAIPDKVAVGGDSAGGNLAAVVSQLARDDEDPQSPKPVLQWLIYPRTDFTAKTRSLSLFAEGFLLTKADMDWFEAGYLGGSGIETTDPRASPLLADTR